MRTSLTVLSLTASLVFVAAPPAHPQVSGLLKKKIKEAAKAPDKNVEKADQPAAGQGPQFNERMVELTTPVVAGMLKGLDTEIAQLTEFKQLLGAYKTEDQYEDCTQSVARLPDAQKIMMQIANLPSNATSEQVQATTEKMNTAMNELIAKTCGASIEADWPTNKRQEKVAEIHRKAAVAAGLLLRGSSQGQPGGAGSAPERSSPASYDPGAVGAADMLPPTIPRWEYHEPLVDHAATQSAQQAGSTARYDLAWERFEMLCAYKKAKPEMFKNIKGYNLTVSASFYQKGLAGNVYFTAAEVEAIEPQCDSKLVFTTGKIEILMDDIKIIGRRKK